MIKLIFEATCDECEHVEKVRALALFIVLKILKERGWKRVEKTSEQPLKHFCPECVYKNSQLFT